MPYLTHPSGQTTHYHLEDFADPWLPHSTVVIQHGFLRSSDFWYKWVPVLSSEHRVIRLDARGHGRSSAPDTARGDDHAFAHTIDTILDEMIDSLNQLDVEKCHFIGEGTGGIWGMLLAARFPDRISSLTVISTPLYLSPEVRQTLVSSPNNWAKSFREQGSRGLGQSMAAAMAKRNGSDKDSTTAADAKTEGIHGESDAITKWWVSQLSLTKGSALADHAELISQTSFDARPILQSLDETGIPLLIMTRCKSILVNIEDQRHLHRTVRNSVMEIIPTQADSDEIYLDSGDLCQAKFLDFLESVEKRGVIGGRQMEKRRDSGMEVD